MKQAQPTYSKTHVLNSLPAFGGCRKSHRLQDFFFLPCCARGVPTAGVIRMSLFGDVASVYPYGDAIAGNADGMWAFGLSESKYGKESFETFRLGGFVVSKSWFILSKNLRILARTLWARTRRFHELP